MPKAAKPAKAKSTKPAAKVTPIASAPKAPPMPMPEPMSEAERVAYMAMRDAANIHGARLVTGDFVIGKRVNGGLQDVFTIILQPIQTPQGTTNMRVNFLPFVPPFFIRDESRPDVGDRHIMELYKVPDEIADHYMAKRKQIEAQPKAEAPAE